jgi:2-polyprenyl-3-methyl-5-hydroxy-6-metoxy-1,4-benzoquinol methylase
MDSLSSNNSVSSELFYEKDLDQLQAATNYLAWQRRLIRPYLGEKILEIGSGIGTHTLAWAENAISVHGLEPNARCFTRLQEKVSSHANIHALNIYAEEMSDCIPRELKFDTLVSTNVFEHIRNDREVLVNAIDYLAPGAHIILQVPACPWAYGAYDRALGHYRRYDRPQIKALFANIPGKFLCLRYYNTIGILGWWFHGCVCKKSVMADFQLKIFDRFVLPVQSRLERSLELPFGQCLFVVFQYRRNG